MKNRWLLLIFCFLTAVCSAQSLPVSVDANRFLDMTGQTILDINFQVYYRDLKFIPTVNGFEASLETEFAIFQGELKVYEDKFTNKIIVTDEAKTKSGMQFSDKLSMVLSKSGFHFLLQFKDVVSGLESNWEYDFDQLLANSLISDLELSSAIITDPSKFQEKFQRGNQSFLLNTNHVFALPETDSIFIYFELNNFSRDAQGLSNLQEDIFLKKKNELKFEKTDFIRQPDSLIIRLISIPIGALEEGYYDIDVRITDIISGLSEMMSDFLSIKKSRLFSERMFISLDDEFKLVSYFLQGTQLKTWKTLSETGKINYLNRFWMQNDPDPISEDNEFFDKVRNRIAYCNENFSHFEPGWTTDRGRIFLRHGQPDEVLEQDTGLYTKYSQKEFIIWKFRSKANRTYIFIDLQTSGNFRLIYADGDSSESSAANWQDYLGEDFDLNLLQ